MKLEAGLGVLLASFGSSLSREKEGGGFSAQVLGEPFKGRENQAGWNKAGQGRILLRQGETREFHC